MDRTPHRGEATRHEDAAALHPDLQGGDQRGYYRACSALRNELKALVAKSLAIEHDLFLLSNTTQGVMTAMAGLASDGIALRIAPNAYSPYMALPSWPCVADMLKTSLLTHVDPLSGRVSAVSSVAAAPSVLDAAQSFATVVHHRAGLHADIVLCSLHKHAGISAGLGLLAIRRDVPFSGLRTYAEVAEAGACSLSLLEHAIARVQLLDGRLTNLMTLEIDEADRAALKTAEIDVLTPIGARLPFICMRGVDPVRAATACASVGLHVKFFREQNVVRISGAIRGAIDDTPIDCAPVLKRQISILIGGKP
ncbi:DUF6024 family protein [Trinickia sp. NRRL B-1857]|uniref:DUF6024 family protein n=1 Tax=Trinickia sp. NRRL B-1857 TaxID=3162879 RepID=UPI003D26A993